MSFFKRSKPAPTPDPDMPLTTDQAAKLRVLVRTAFAETGIEVTVHPDHVVDDQGRMFGLWNIAAVCNDRPERDWPELVRAHVSRLGQPSDLESMAEEDLAASTYLRLVEVAALPDAEWQPGAVRYGHDLVSLLSVDLPETVSTPKEGFWAARGGLERWHATGRANLLALLMSDDLEHQRVQNPDGQGDFDVVMGDSFFTASTALLLDDVLRRFNPGVDASRGVLLVTPFRHQIAWRVIDGTQDSAIALNNLFRFALAGVSDAPGPLSPNVFWVRSGEWRQITRVEEGQGHVEVDEELADALGLAE